MSLLHPPSWLPVHGFSASNTSRCSRASPSSPAFSIRSTLPFPPDKARFHSELQAAVDVVERACRLCVDVKKSLLSTDGRILEKTDQTPVTIADFSVQALISLELHRLFPSIPLVAEEDSGFLRSKAANLQTGDVSNSNSLVDLVLSAVADKACYGEEPLTSDDVLEAIDRGGKDAVAFGASPATYWVLDPIDGTRGFLKGSDALWVVGLALVVKGEIAVGVLGCPNWKEDSHPVENINNKLDASGPGIIMVSHAGCGTWTKRLSDVTANFTRTQKVWQRCFVDSCFLVQEARFCIPESQTWESMPLSVLFSSIVEGSCFKSDQQIILLQARYGSLCKYLMVASGRASVFIQKTKPQTLIKVWDHAAGVVCVREAGGQTTDWGGNQLDLAADQAERRIIYPSGGVLVTNGKLHKQLLELISSNYSVV